MTMVLGDEFDCRFFPAPWPRATIGERARDLWRDVLHDLRAFDGWKGLAGGRRARNKAPRISRAPSLAMIEDQVRCEFHRLTERIALTGQEWSLLLGADFSEAVLALEIVGAALGMHGDAVAALDWLRAANAEPPFFGRAPLELIRADGRLGAEIALIHLRARQRRHQAEASQPLPAY